MSFCHTSGLISEFNLNFAFLFLHAEQGRLASTQQTITICLLLYVPFQICWSAVLPLSFALLHWLPQNAFKEHKRDLVEFHKICNDRSYFSFFTMLVVWLWCKLCRLWGRHLDWGLLDGKLVCCWYVHTFYWMWIILFSSGGFHNPCCIISVALLEKSSLSCFSGLVADGDWGLRNDMSLCHFYFHVEASCPTENFVPFRKFHTKA